MVDDPNGRTGLYRLFDAEDVLLYVGISHRPQGRWRQHGAQKAWWPQVVRKEIVWYATRLAAGTAEQSAIKEKDPKYNDQREVRRVALINLRGKRTSSAPCDTPSDPVRLAVQDTRARYEAARATLFAAINAALKCGVAPAPVARASGFSRTYIAKIRDGKGTKGI